MERLAAALPPGFSFEWTGISYEEQQSAGQIGLLLGLSLVVVFLLLAALYESWAVPVAVLLVVPIGMLGAVLLSMIRGYNADIYFNVGLITIIGWLAWLVFTASVISELVVVVSRQRIRIRLP